MRRVAIPQDEEWITLNDVSGRFYPVTLASSVVLVDEHGSVWAELFDSDRTNLVFRTLQPMGREDLRTAFSHLVYDSFRR
jgi:hypothetical protein